ncbi:MAG: hypothetical protein JW895_07210 [Thermoleophilaceae bacterium]|nr:hypothetical protein [Thermoleophilaceae bacterium]
MNRLFSIGGVAASIILIAVGVGAIAIGASGVSEVRDTVKRENIVGTPDMTPDQTRAALEEANLSDLEAPTCTVAGDRVDDGDSAKCFADYIRVHALEATGGQTYAEMARFLDENGDPVEDEADAAKDPETGKPVENAQRNLWVTATALSTALNTSYFAEQVGTFAIVMGIALLLTGIGFLVLTLGVLRRSNRDTEAAAAAV